jgi:hypothetical protein
MLVSTFTADFGPYFLDYGPFMTGFGFTYFFSGPPNICFTFAIFNFYSGVTNFFFYFYSGFAGGITTIGGL